VLPPPTESLKAVLQREPRQRLMAAAWEWNLTTKDGEKRRHDDQRDLNHGKLSSKNGDLNKRTSSNLV